MEQETLRGNGWIPVRIPSNVQEYFCDEDMFYSDNLTKLLWTEEKIWVYTVDFIVNKGRDKKYFLRFKGVDYFSCIYLNGKKLAEHEGMYSDVHLDVNESLQMGDNCLEVALYIPEELRKKDNMDRVLKCHSQYGWDFAPRLLTMGIWDEVILEELENCWIGDIQVKTSITKFNSRWEYVFADMVFVVTPVILIYLTAQRYIINGMTAGAIKG